jgi:hypothetical protein
MRTKLARFVLHAAFGIGVCAATATLGQAQYGSYAPPSTGYGAPGCATPYSATPAPVISSAPGIPSMPRISGGEQPSTEQQPQQPQIGQQPQAEQQPQAAAENAANAPPADTGAGATGGEAGLGGGTAESSGGFLGRGDANNRFNLFDNNSAFPTNRVWFTFEQMQNFTTGVRIGFPSHLVSPSVQEAFGLGREVNLYRLGGELKLSDHCSIAFQDQYVASPGALDAADAWANPEFMLKWAFILEQNNAVAATLGVQPQVASNNGELHEKDTRYLPGILAYQGSSDSGLFFQEGAQFGISDRDISDTFDWALMTGYWLYRAQTSEGNHPCLSGIAPQLEVFGKHVMVGSQNQPFDIPIGGFSSSSSSSVTPSSLGEGAPFREPRNVIDVTAGGRILLYDKISISAGYSFPVTGGDVRRNEFLANVTFLF